MIIVDFETSYTPRTPKGERPHGLGQGKQTVPEYLRDERTECLGAAVSISKGGEWKRGYLRGGDLGRVLVAAANGQFGQIAAHNATFDLSVWARFYPDSYKVMHQRLTDSPRRVLDTQQLARWASSQGLLPHHVGVRLAELGEYYGLTKGDTAEAVAGDGDLEAYAIRDAEITELIVEDLAGKWPWREAELAAVHLLMSIPGPHNLCVNADLLKPVAEQSEEEKARASWLRKDENFANLLTKLGVPLQYKTTKTGREKLALSKTDGFMRELLKHEDKRVRKAAELRLSAGSNINRTRARTMLDASGEGREALPLSIMYYAAHTGRSGGSGGMNPQNLPRGGLHRRALMAPEGYKLVACDASQIEVRVLAWLADDRVTLEVFEHGGDPYKAFAVDLYGLDNEGAVTKDQRQVAKSAVLGLGFGAGAGGFLNYCKIMGVEIEENEARRVVHAYRRARPAVPAYWQQIEHSVRSSGQHVLPSGRVMVYPEMTRDTFTRPVPFQKTKGEVSKLWHGLLTENAVQAAARDITLAEHAVEIGSRWPVVLMVHDEIVCCVPQDQAQECLHDMMQVMSTAPSWAISLPLAAEGDIGDRYGELK